MGPGVREKSRISARADNGVFFYYRRVPKAVGHLDQRRVIRVTLGTTDEAEATMKARQLDEDHERLWATILGGADPTRSWERYETAVALARNFGFTYRDLKQVAEENLDTVVERILAAKSHKKEPAVLDAILGGVEEPEVSLNNLWTIYARHRGPELKGLSPRQLIKHETARKAVVASVVAVLGNKRLKDVVRGDVLRYRDAWAARVKAGEVTIDTANRRFSDIKGMISAVDDALQTSFGDVWKSMNIRKRGKAREKKRTRPPYPVEFVQTQMLKPGAMDGMNLDARLIVYAMVETGLRLSEACNLQGHGIDIFLDAKIPYLKIEERDDREQKTVYSIRQIPLVGVSLWALKQSPNGFPRYFDKGDNASAVINKFLRENGLQPTPKHTVYSLRHTFQDRLLAAGAPDRLQTDLMGHEFEREAYGSGASMEQKLDMLDRIKFKWPIA